MILLYYQGKISSDMILKGNFEALVKNYEYLRTKNEYLKKQLWKSIKNKRRHLHSDLASSLG